MNKQEQTAQTPVEDLSITADQAKEVKGGPIASECLQNDNGIDGETSSAKPLFSSGNHLLNFTKVLLK